MSVLLGHHFAWPKLGPKGLNRPVLTLRRKETPRGAMLLFCAPGVFSPRTGDPVAWWLGEEGFAEMAGRDMGPANPRKLAEHLAEWRDA